MALFKQSYPAFRLTAWVPKSVAEEASLRDASPGFLSQPLCHLVGSWVAALRVFGSPPAGCIAAGAPREGRETKGNERKRPKSQLCNPSRSFFWCSGQKSCSYPRGVTIFFLEALSPESGTIGGAKGQQGERITGCLRTFSVRLCAGSFPRQEVHQTAERTDPVKKNA